MHGRKGISDLVEDDMIGINSDPILLLVFEPLADSDISNVIFKQSI